MAESYLIVQMRVKKKRDILLWKTLAMVTEVLKAQASHSIQPNDKIVRLPAAGAFTREMRIDTILWQEIYSGNIRKFMLYYCWINQYDKSGFAER